MGFADDVFDRYAKAGKDGAEPDADDANAPAGGGKMLLAAIKSGDAAAVEEAIRNIVGV